VARVGEARGRAQFPGQGFLAARPFESLQVVILGYPDRCSLQSSEVALDAQQLRNAPALFGALGPLERVVDYRSCISRLACSG